MSEQDGFQVIGRSSGYEIIEQSIRQQPGNQTPQLIYQVIIRPSKSEVDLNLVENQFYEMKVLKYGQQIALVQRRYSDFALIYEILNKKEPGYIFPAFPENGIFAFVYSKLTIAKDQNYIKRRTQVIERFFNSIFNNTQFSPQFCKQVKEFLSEGKEFQVRKQLQKKQNGVFGFTWGKLKNYFTASEGGKYQNNQQKINALKTGFQQLYHYCHEMIQYLYEQRIQNNKIQQIIDNHNYIQNYKNQLISHDASQKQNIDAIQSLQFELFCENEDLLMAKKVIDRMNELKNDEDNYQQLKHIEQKFNKKIENFLIEKGKTKLQSEEKLKDIMNDIKFVSRFGK